MMSVIWGRPDLASGGSNRRFDPNGDIWLAEMSPCPSQVARPADRIPHSALGADMRRREFIAALGARRRHYNRGGTTQTSPCHCSPLWVNVTKSRA
jgi:hypothetical protein